MPHLTRRASLIQQARGDELLTTPGLSPPTSIHLFPSLAHALLEQEAAERSPLAKVAAARSSQVRTQRARARLHTVIPLFPTDPRFRLPFLAPGPSSLQSRHHQPLIGEQLPHMREAAGGRIPNNLGPLPRSRSSARSIRSMLSARAPRRQARSCALHPQMTSRR